MLIKENPAVEAVFLGWCRREHFLAIGGRPDYHGVMELKGKTALITGATGKIGRVLVPALAREGIHCVCHYYKQEEASRRLTAEVDALGCRVLAWGADLRDEAQIRELFRRAEEWGSIDLLIYAAGLFEKAPITELDMQRATALVQVNLLAPIYLTHLFLDGLLKRKKPEPADEPCGKIVYFTDASAERPWRNYSIYCASKAGLSAAVKSLAKELAPTVTVNAVAPGIVEGSLPGAAEEMRQLGRIPGGRFPTMEEVTEAVLFLLRDDGITGQNVVVDGGSIL